MAKASEARLRGTRENALGRAIRRHIGDLSQAELASMLGMAQNSVSLWERGGVDLTCGQVAAIERCLGLRPGTLLIEAGYVDVSLVGGAHSASCRVGVARNPAG